MARLSHYGKRGEARMVDVSAKPATARRAVARGFVRMSPRAVAAIRHLSGKGKKGAASGAAVMRKGHPLEVARIAGIAAAKRTSELVPLCHPLPLTHVDVTACLRENGVELEATVRTTAPTGVEMEALTAVSVAALTVYDMCKALDRGMTLTDIVLVEKTGGRSGRYRRPENLTRRGRGATPRAGRGR